MTPFCQLAAEVLHRTLSPSPKRRELILLFGSKLTSTKQELLVGPPTSVPPLYAGEMGRARNPKTLFAFAF